MLATKRSIRTSVCSTVRGHFALLDRGTALHRGHAWDPRHRGRRGHAGSEAVTVALCVVQAIASLLGEREGHRCGLVQGLNGAFQDNGDVDVARKASVSRTTKVHLFNANEVAVGPFL